MIKEWDLRPAVYKIIIKTYDEAGVSNRTMSVASSPTERTRPGEDLRWALKTSLTHSFPGVS